MSDSENPTGIPTRDVKGEGEVKGDVKGEVEKDQSSFKPLPDSLKPTLTEELQDIYDSSAINNPTRCTVCMAAIKPELRKAGSKVCLAHGGARYLKREVIKLNSNYRLSLWQSRLDEKSQAPELKSLRDEASIARILIEETMNKISPDDETSLQLHRGAILQALDRVHGLVVSIHKIDKDTGRLLDKTVVIQMAQAISGIISEVLSGVDLPTETRNSILDQIQTKIAALMTDNEGAVPTSDQ